MIATTAISQLSQLFTLVAPTPPNTPAGTMVLCDGHVPTGGLVAMASSSSIFIPSAPHHGNLR